ncbi:unnamed protein product, partial [Rhizophagus irregularis]
DDIEDMFVIELLGLLFTKEDLNLEYLFTRGIYKFQRRMIEEE